MSRLSGPFPRGSGVLTRTMAEKLACDMLARDGVTAIWDLHLAALTAKDAGKLELTASLVEIAEAAERLWLDGVQREIG